MKIKIFVISIALLSAWVFLIACNSSGGRLKLQEPVVMRDRADSSEKNRPETHSNAVKDKTTDNMLAAYLGETIAAAKYAAFSAKASKEGHLQVALLFKAASMAEKIHADNHRTILRDKGIKVPPVNPEFTVKSTTENLQHAIKGESYESAVMYPEFLKDADTEGNQMALISFNYAVKTEKKHGVLFETALAAIEKNNEKSLSGIYYVCPTCGNTYDKLSSLRCGICMTGSEKYLVINSL
jgi:rubrerythrin